MELPTKVLGLIGSGFVGLTTIYTGATFTHDHLQQVDQMQQTIVLIDMRMDLKILSDRMTALQARLWKIEERYGTDLFDAPGPVRDEYKQISQELERIRSELLALQQEYRRQNNSGNSGRFYERKPLEMER